MKAEVYDLLPSTIPCFSYCLVYSGSHSKNLHIGANLGEMNRVNEVEELCQSECNIIYYMSSFT